MRGGVEIGAGVGDHRDAADLEFGAGCVDRPGCLPAEVLGDRWSREARIGDHAVTDDVAEFDQSRRSLIRFASRDPARPLVRLAQQNLVGDVDLVDHQQAEMTYEELAKCVSVDVSAGYVQPEAL